ncbi:MAG: GNAT family N-acetyltransferase [Pseudomonadota bacterium]
MVDTGFIACRWRHLDAMADIRTETQRMHEKMQPEHFPSFGEHTAGEHTATRNRMSLEIGPYLLRLPLLPRSRIAFGIESGGALKAYALCRIGAMAVRPGMPRLRQCALDDIAVHPDHRRRGYGLRLLRAVREEMARRGIIRLTAEVWGWNEASAALFTRAGFLPQCTSYALDDAAETPPARVSA